MEKEVSGNIMISVIAMENGENLAKIYKKEYFS